MIPDPAARPAGPGPVARPRAILISYLCVPGLGSEMGAGWAWARAAAEVADVTLLVAPWPQGARLEETVAELGLPIDVRWVGFPVNPRYLPRRIRDNKAVSAAWYGLWHLQAARAVRRFERSSPVDVVHHVTMSGDSLPSALLASRAPVRIWGPVGGSTRTPLGLYRYLSPRGRLSEVVRDVGSGSLRAVFGSLTARRATLVVALNQDVERRWRRVPTPVVVESAIALDAPDDADDDYLPGAPGERVALFVGRLLSWKGLLLAIESMRFAPGWRLVVLGDGPDRRAAEARAVRLGLCDRVEFRGPVPREAVLSAFRRADALLFPSFHDSAGWAVAEAASLGCPVVCLDAGGPALQAGMNGYVVPVDPPGSLPRRLGERLVGLEGRRPPDDHLRWGRLPGLLRNWYSGGVAGADGSPDRSRQRAG